MKFSQEPMDEPLAIIAQGFSKDPPFFDFNPSALIKNPALVDLADLDRVNYGDIYNAISHIFPKENVRDKITSILYQNMNIQTNSENKRERWIIQVDFHQKYKSDLSNRYQCQIEAKQSKLTITQYKEKDYGGLF